MLPDIGISQDVKKNEIRTGTTAAYNADELNTVKYFC